MEYLDLREDEDQDEMPHLSLDDDSGANDPLLRRYPAGKNTSRQSPQRRLYMLLCVALALLLTFWTVSALVLAQASELATKAIAKTNMSISQMQLTEPRNRSVQLSLTMRMTSLSMFKVQIAPTNFEIRYAPHSLPNDTLTNASRVGIFQSPPMQVHKGNNVQHFENSTLQITNFTLWNAFAHDLVTSEQVNYTIWGKLDLKVILVFGVVKLPVNGVELVKQLSFDGMNQLHEIRIAGIDLTGSTTHSIGTTIKTCVKNPSVTTMIPVGSLCMQAYHPSAQDDAYLGKFQTLPDTSISIGKADKSHPFCASLATNLAEQNDLAFGYNLLELNGDMVDKNPSVVSHLFSQFVSGNDTQLTVATCSPHASSIPIYDGAMQDLRIPATLPSLSTMFPDMPSLVVSTVLYKPSIFHLTHMATALALRNPFNQSITVNGIDLQLYPCENQTNVNGTLHCFKYYTTSLARFAPNPFVAIEIPAATKGCYSCCQGSTCRQQEIPLCPSAEPPHTNKCMEAAVEAALNPEAISALLHLATSGLLMHVRGTIDASIGEFSTQLQYEQQGLVVVLE